MRYSWKVPVALVLATFARLSASALSAQALPASGASDRYDRHRRGGAGSPFSRRAQVRHPGDGGVQHRELREGEVLPVSAVPDFRPAKHQRQAEVQGEAVPRDRKRADGGGVRPELPRIEHRGRAPAQVEHPPPRGRERPQRARHRDQPDHLDSHQVTLRVGVGNVDAQLAWVVR